MAKFCSDCETRPYKQGAYTGQAGIVLYIEGTERSYKLRFQGWLTRADSEHYCQRNIPKFLASAKASSRRPRSWQALRRSRSFHAYWYSFPILQHHPRSNTGDMCDDGWKAIRLDDFSLVGDEYQFYGSSPRKAQETGLYKDSTTTQIDGLSTSHGLSWTIDVDAHGDRFSRL